MGNTVAHMRLPQLSRTIVVVAAALAFFATVAAHGRTQTANKYQQVVPSPASLNFGSLQVGTSLSQTETLTNSGTQSVTIYQSSTTGSGFTSSGLTTPLALKPGQSYTFTVTFAPLSSGSFTGAVALISRTGHTAESIPLSGQATAAGQLTASPTALNFGTVTVGSSGSLIETVTASGASVTISSGTSSSAEFILSGATFPLTLAPGQSASLTVAFAPTSSGTASASISLLSNATDSLVVDTATGTGAPAPQHSVGLSWSASNSVVMGYNVYRGPTSGGPYSKINTALDTSTTYTDTTVVAGQTYFYAATAVDDTGNESSYSNQVQAVIPTP